MRFLVLIVALITVASCNMELLFMPAPDDFNFSPVQEDTTSAPVVVVDTCEFLVPIDTPVFMTLTIHFFNGQPADLKWNIQGQYDTVFTDLVGMLEYMYPQYEYTYYERNNSVSVIVDGVNNNDLFQGLIYTHDAIQQKALMTAFGQTFYWWGALEFEEGIAEAKKRPSQKSFHFTNFGWTVEQNNQFARVALHPELCKRGEYIARLVNAGIVPSLVDSFELFQWEFVLQLNDQLIKA